MQVLRQLSSSDALNAPAEAAEKPAGTPAKVVRKVVVKKVVKKVVKPTVDGAAAATQGSSEALAAMDRAPSASTLCVLAEEAGAAQATPAPAPPHVEEAPSTSAPADDVQPNADHHSTPYSHQPAVQHEGSTGAEGRVSETGTSSTTGRAPASTTVPPRRRSKPGSTHHDAAATADSPSTHPGPKSEVSQHPNSTQPTHTATHGSDRTMTATSLSEPHEESAVPSVELPPDLPQLGVDGLAALVTQLHSALTAREQQLVRQAQQMSQVQQVRR